MCHHPSHFLLIFLLIVICQSRAILVKMLRVLQANENEEEVNLHSLFENWSHHLLRSSIRNPLFSSRLIIEAISVARIQIHFQWMANHAQATVETVKFMEVLWKLIVNCDEPEVVHFHVHSCHSFHYIHSFSGSG